MITDRLFEMQDTGYRDFQRRLMPDIPKEKVEGYRGQNSGAAKAGKGACRHRGSRRLYITASA